MIHQQIAQQYNFANMAAQQQQEALDLGEGYGQGTQHNPYTMDGIDVLLANPVPPPPMFGPDGVLIKQEPGLVKPEMMNPMDAFGPLQGMMPAPDDMLSMSPDDPMSIGYAPAEV